MDEKGVCELENGDEDFVELDHNELWPYDEPEGVPEGVETAEWEAL